MGSDLRSVEFRLSKTTAVFPQCRLGTVLVSEIVYILNNKRNNLLRHCMSSLLQCRTEGKRRHSLGFYALRSPQNDRKMRCDATWRAQLFTLLGASSRN